MESQKPSTPQSSQKPVSLHVSPQQTSVHFANMCRGSMTPEEVLLDFGLNPNAFGQVAEEGIQISSRVVMTLPSAKRLLHLLHVMLSRHEESFGPIPVEPKPLVSETSKTTVAGA